MQFPSPPDDPEQREEYFRQLERFAPVAWVMVLVIIVILVAAFYGGR